MALRVPTGPPVIVLVAVLYAATPGATMPDPAGDSIERFLAQDGAPPSYHGTRRLEAEQGSQSGWLEAVTDYSHALGFRYRVTAEGGSSTIRTRVLKAVLDGERELIAYGGDARSALAPANYRFEANGIDNDGLANVLVAPRRKEHGLVSGTLFLTPSDGAIVKLKGRLAKSPSFWVKDVDIVRTYQRIEGVVVPVGMESKAQVRFLGEGRLRMIYTYSEIDGHAVAPGD